MAARSIVINLHNNLDANGTHPGRPHHLKQTGARLSHGVWTPNRVPPYTVDAGSTVSFEAESQGFMTGVEGSVTFQELSYGAVTLNFDNPYKGDNKCSVSTQTLADGWAILPSYDSHPRGDNTTWDVTLNGPPPGRAGALKHTGTGRYVDNVGGSSAPDTPMCLWGTKQFRDTIVLTEQGMLYHCGSGCYIIPQNLQLSDGCPIVLAPWYLAFEDSIVPQLPKWEYRDDHAIGIRGHDFTMTVLYGVNSQNGARLTLWSGKQTPFNAFTFEDA